MSDVTAFLEGKRVCICGGPGGVGKTTISAAIALAMAGRGMKVAVVTIDPAKRLAAALGLEELPNEPHLVGLELDGELWAMMLDAKRTFDDLIERLAPDESARDDVLGNRIYQQLSTAVAGSQEFTAIAKLYELDREGGFDLIVLDTPPSRNALDFLEAPERLTNFFEGRALRVLMRPAGIAGRIVGTGTGVVFAVLKRITGVDLLQDLSTFFRALGGMVDGFRERALQVDRLLHDPATTFLVVSSPEPDAVEEALFFGDRVREAGLHLGGAIVNRLNPDPLPDGDVPNVARELEAPLGRSLARAVARTFDDHTRLARRDAANLDRVRAALGGAPVIAIPLLEGDVHDVEGLAAVGRHLA